MVPAAAWGPRAGRLGPRLGSRLPLRSLPVGNARGAKVCGAVMAPAPPGRAQYAPGSVGPGCGRRSGAAPLLGRGRCLALSGMAPPVASGRGCPPAASLRRWLRPLGGSAPGPVGSRCGCGLALLVRLAWGRPRLACGLAAPVSPPSGSPVPPGRAFPLAPPPGGRAAAGRGMAAPCSAPPPRLAPGAGVVRCGGVACRWCLWYNRTKVR